MGCRGPVLKASSISLERTAIQAHVRIANDVADIRGPASPPSFGFPASKRQLDVHMLSYTSKPFEAPDAYPLDLHYTDPVLPLESVRFGAQLHCSFEIMRFFVSNIKLAGYRDSSDSSRIFRP
ncbi:hypothetical protein CVT25_015209 [Psilocybe cyanescens]|uniref:Uncharacterized protein n=1 Tax=Psilocybe cyanescens TaxID=93625 RepID=A0A409WRN4_PSICY|nr:hypothetical protein CVT25_015209 [Psilocybe cyanescens]